jgi:uncharacterized membrane protein
MQDQSTTRSRRQQTPTDVPQPGNSHEINIGQLERWLSVIGGGVLAVYALRRSLWGLALVVGGGALVYRGLTGHCAMYEATGIYTSTRQTDPKAALRETATQ